MPGDGALLGLDVPRTGSRFLPAPCKLGGPALAVGEMPVT